MAHAVIQSAFAEVILLLFQFIAVLATTLFAGAAIYINVAEHPARMECGTAVAATVFGPSYRRAAVMQAVLALVSTATAIVAWFMGAASAWLMEAVLIFAVVPFTLLVIKPTNQKLRDPAIDRSSDAVTVCATLGKTSCLSQLSRSGVLDRLSRFARVFDTKAVTCGVRSTGPWILRRLIRGHQLRTGSHRITGYILS
jgi:hypothetical protein